MRKYKKKKKDTKSQVKDLANLFEAELNNHIDIVVLPNNAGIKYKNYLVKELPNKSWGLFDLRSKEYLDEFYLKSSALMGAKAYTNVNLKKYAEIKAVDRKFWACQSDILTCKHYMKSAADFTRYLILLNKLEESKYKSNQYKSEITKMFRWAFV